MRNDSGDDDRRKATGRFRGLKESWKPGQSGNPSGRPTGARNKLSEAFLDALVADFHDNGVAAIVACREASPETYIRVIASILPKEITAEFTQRFVARLPEPSETTEEWVARYSPKLQ